MSKAISTFGEEVGEAPPCELRQAQFGLFLLRIFEPDWWAVQGYVADRVGSAPGLLQHAAIVLDVDQLPQWPSAEQAADLLARLRAAGLQPIALATDPGENSLQLARLFGLPTVPTERGRRRSSGSRVSEVTDGSNAPATAESPAAFEAAPASAPAAVPVPASPGNAVTQETAGADGSIAGRAETPAPAAPLSISPMFVSQPVRSGQQVYARGRDLVVNATVSPGAEVIADGSIHVYGRLGGKALAGARGDEQARIFCLDFQPELVSIAGHYRLLESIPESARGRSVQVLLEGERMEIKPLRGS
jgi:septum site-determining protein MinC